MYQKKMEPDIRCPFEYGISLLSGKWKSRVICVLWNRGAQKYGGIKQDLIDISDGVLGATLSELGRADLVDKKDDLYMLTEKGRSLIPVIMNICKWSGTYYKESNGIVMKHCLECSIHKEWAKNVNDGFSQIKKDEKKI